LPTARNLLLAGGPWSRPWTGAAGGERGLRGKEGLRWWFGLAGVGISAGKVPGPRRILLKLGGLEAIFIA